MGARAEGGTDLRAHSVGWVPVEGTVCKCLTYHTIWAETSQVISGKPGSA